MLRLFNPADKNEPVIVSIKCDVKIGNQDFTAFDGNPLECCTQDHFARSFKYVNQAVELAKGILELKKEEITNDKITLTIQISGKFDNKEISAEFHDMDSYKQFLIAENMMVDRRLEIK